MSKRINNNGFEHDYEKNENGKVIIEKVQKLFVDDFSGHDFYHTERVYKNAIRIAEKMECNKEIIMLASLLHDVDDPKLFKTKNNANARTIMQEAHIKEDVINQVISIIQKISFKGTGQDVPSLLEGKIVQDADRLDALGAIGIARAFAYGGTHKRQMYDPMMIPVLNMDEETYHNSQGTTINHFYEKLLLLKDMMNTEMGKKIAEERTKYMEEYLKEFFQEWEGKF